MKKRINTSKILIAGAVFSSAFVATQTVEASSDIHKQAENFVKQAERDAVSLKSAITITNKSQKTLEIPWAQYNKTKKSYEKAKAALSKLKGKEKLIYETRLQQNVAIYIGTKDNKAGRAIAYIDALNAGKRLVEKSKDLDLRLNKNILDNETVKIYKELSGNFKKQAALFDKVYGAATREKIKSLYKKPAELVLDKSFYPVSIKIQLDQAEIALKEKRSTDASAYLNNANKLVQEALKQGKLTKSSALQLNIQERFDNLSKKYSDINSPVVKTPATPEQPPVVVKPSTPEQPPVVVTPPVDTRTVYDAPGVYGPDNGTRTVEGNISITSDHVTLKNMVIHGDLIISDAVGEGEVHLQNVTITGKTYVKGGGMHSVYFENSVLATVIVNKNNGAVRIVATGNTQVAEVQLESYGKIEESNLTGNADGFENVTVNETVQSTNPDLSVQLVGSFETINSRASQVRINLSESTSIETLVLNAAAAVLGSGIINTAQINSSGSTISNMPQNVVLNNGATVVVAGEEVTESQSSEQQTSLKNIHLSQAGIKADFDHFVAGLSLSDFKVSATLDDEAISLDNLAYDASLQRFTFSPVALEGNMGKTLKVNIEPASDSTKLTGQGTIAETTIDSGFSGRITDIAGVGVEGAVIKFRQGLNNQDGEVVETASTDQNGFYSINLPAGEYTGEISGPGLVPTYLYASAPSDVFNTNQNETAIRAAASSEIKLMLSWGDTPHDLDSHLIGKTIDGTDLHTAYYQKTFEENGITYVDLDWDDVNSYGPETTSIRKLRDGKYVFYVNNFSNDSALDTSKAVIKLFKGNSTTPDQVFNVPDGNGDERVWVAFKIEISNNGENVQITPINKLESDEMMSPFYLNPVEALQNLINNGTQILQQWTPYDTEKQAVQTALDAASPFLHNNDTTTDQFYNAYKNLSKALDAYNNVMSPFFQNPVEELQGRVNEGTQLLQSRTQPCPEREAVQTAVDAANLLIQNSDGTIEQLYNAYMDLGNAVDAYNNVRDTERVETQQIHLNEFHVYYLDNIFGSLLDNHGESFTYEVLQEPSNHLFDYHIIEDDGSRYGEIGHDLTLLPLHEGNDSLVIKATNDLGETALVTFNFEILPASSDNPAENGNLHAQILNYTWDDMDEDNKVSTGDNVHLTLGNLLSDLNLPSTVGVSIKDNGEEDVIVLYNSTTDFTVENEIGSISTTSNLVAGDSVFGGTLSAAGESSVTIQLGDMIQE